MDDEIEERLDRTEEMKKEVGREQSEFQAALEQGDPAALTALQHEGVIETLLDPDVSSDDDLDDDLGSYLKTMLSRVNMLANITREDWEANRPLHRNRADRLKAGRPSVTGAGSKCTGEFREIVVGEDAEPLTPDQARRLDEAAEVREKQESLAIGGKAFDGMTKIQSAVYTERGDDENSGGGGGSAFSRARSLLPGGG